MNRNIKIWFKSNKHLPNYFEIELQTGVEFVRIKYRVIHIPYSRLGNQKVS